ncbi:MAG: hypothetical protein ACREBG_29975 [Pyrinomonadaceae bacterium]
MSTNKSTDFLEAGFGESSEPATVLRDEVRAEKAKPTRAYFYPLPNYASDRRYDPRSRDNENAVMLPYTDGYLERFEQMALPGWYYVELRAGNQMLGGDVHEVEPGGRSVESEPVQRGQSQTTHSATSSAHGIADAAQVVRETKSLISELVPKQQPSVGIAKEDVVRMIESAVQNLQPARSESGGVGFKEIYQMLRDERKEAREEVRSFLRIEPQLDPETQATVYFVKQTGALKEMLKATRDVITTPERIDEPTSWSDKILAFAREFVPYVGPRVAPKLADKLNALLDRVEPAALMQAVAQGNGAQVNGSKSPASQVPNSSSTSAVTQAQAEPISAGGTPQVPLSMFPAELRQLFDQLVDALARDLSPDLGASMLTHFVNDHPEHAELINGLVDDSPFNIVLALCQWPEYAYVAKLRHNATWIADLQDAYSELLESQSSEADGGNGGQQADREVATKPRRTDQE